MPSSLLSRRLFPYTTLFRSNGFNLLPLSLGRGLGVRGRTECALKTFCAAALPSPALRATSPQGEVVRTYDRKSTRLNSSHLVTSYADFCLEKKKTPSTPRTY